MKNIIYIIVLGIGALLFGACTDSDASATKQKGEKPSAPSAGVATDTRIKAVNKELDTANADLLAAKIIRKKLIEDQAKRKRDLEKIDQSIQASTKQFQAVEEKVDAAEDKLDKVNDELDAIVPESSEDPDPKKAPAATSANTTK